MIPGVFILADARGQVADFLSALILVYTLIIFVYIITSLVFSFGGRMPYNRWSDAVLGFLRDVCEPYLLIFRRFIPPLGPLDISPIVAILLLQFGGGILVAIVRG
jgi:YggT family protein